MNVIEVADVRKAYGAKVAVDGISLAVERGEILGILGPNGAGKTTLVECMAGLRRPDTGSARVLGIDPAADRPALTRVLGIQLQDSLLQDKITVREALELYASFYENPAAYEPLVARLGLGDRIDTRFAKLSGGQKQRLSVALALIGRPEVVVLDELTTGLDPRARHEVWELVEEIRADGTTIVLVTHFMEEAQRLCDRIAFIRDGLLAALDTPSGLVARSGAAVQMSFAPSAPIEAAALAALPGVDHVEFSGQRVVLTGTDDGVEAVLAALPGLGVVPHRLRVNESSLDDAFLALTDDSARS